MSSTLTCRMSLGKAEMWHHEKIKSSLHYDSESHYCWDSRSDILVEKQVCDLLDLLKWYKLRVRSIRVSRDFLLFQRPRAPQPKTKAREERKSLSLSLPAFFCVRPFSFNCHFWERNPVFLRLLCCEWAVELEIHVGGFRERISKKTLCCWTPPSRTTWVSLSSQQYVQDQ